MARLAGCQSPFRRPAGSRPSRPVGCLPIASLVFVFVLQVRHRRVGRRRLERQCPWELVSVVLVEVVVVLVEVV